MNLPFFDRRTLRKLSSAGIMLISFTVAYGQTKTKKTFRLTAVSSYQSHLRVP